MKYSEDCVTLALGEGARATRNFISEKIQSRYSNRFLNSLPDAAHPELSTDRIAVTTDSFVVSPLFFPGGDIGSLAVYGTVNDLAVSGAVPRWLSLALIIEEGFPLATLDQILDSIAAAAQQCGVLIITGDTKVVPRGAADGLFINTTGIGELHDHIPAGPQSMIPGDLLLVSGPIGRHGIAVLSAREDLALEPPPVSDSAPLTAAVAAMRQKAGDSIRAIRDATRGGVAAVLHEWADACGLTMQLNENRLPVTDSVRGACELLGLDPLYIANEGTLVAAVDPAAAPAALAALNSVSESQSAVEIGCIVERQLSAVTIQRLLGGIQPVDEPEGSPLPRIC